MTCKSQSIHMISPEAVLAIRPGRPWPIQTRVWPTQTTRVIPWSPRTPLLLAHPKFAWPLTGLPKSKFLQLPPDITTSVNAVQISIIHETVSALSTLSSSGISSGISSTSSSLSTTVISIVVVSVSFFALPSGCSFLTFCSLYAAQSFTTISSQATLRTPSQYFWVRQRWVSK